MSKRKIQAIIDKHIRQEAEKFMPDTGQTYVNGSLPRGPLYVWEVAKVAADAKPGAKDETLRSFKE